LKNYALVIHPKDEDEGFRRAELIGCLDSHTVVKFEREIDELLEDGTDRVVLNLEGLSYISSAGISALMGLTHRLRQRNGELLLLRPSEKVLRVFRTLGFTSIFRIIEDEADVTASFKGD
jgi:anti-sigma B factor antagonist